MTTIQAPKEKRTRLKFYEQVNAEGLIGFVREMGSTLIGVPETDKHPKKVVLLSPELNVDIIPNALYDCTVRPMKSGKGYVVVEAELHTFPAVIETIYIPKVEYKITVKFGNKTIIYDIIRGRSIHSGTINGVGAVLAKRYDILDREEVCRQFIVAAKTLRQHFDADKMIQSINGKLITENITY